MTIIPGDIKTAQLHAYLLGSVGPRPICFASTMDESGRPNLSPFSFFNVFGSKPPILVFSPARRVRDNTIKHTLENALATKEVVINVVNYAIVQQMSLASCEYPKGVSEFEKSGLTPIPSEIVKPYRVKESPVQLECKVKEVYVTGEEGGAGNLIICEVLCMHINDDILNEQQQIDPHKIDLVARMGGDYYCRASGDAVFTVPKPITELGIGVDAMPERIRKSNILTGNDLGLLGNVKAIPIHEELKDDNRLQDLLREYNSSPDLLRQKLHEYAHELLQSEQVEQAWTVLLAGE